MEKILDADTGKDNGLGRSCFDFRVLGLSADSPSLGQRKGPLLFIMVFFSPPPPQRRFDLFAVWKKPSQKEDDLWNFLMRFLLSKPYFIQISKLFTEGEQEAPLNSWHATCSLILRRLPVFFVLLLVFLPSERQGQRGASAVCNKCCYTEPTGKLYSPRPAITV